MLRVRFAPPQADTEGMSPAPLTPAEVITLRRRAASEVLAAAAAHSLLTDELHDLEALRRERPWTPDEEALHRELRSRLEDARRRHDDARHTELL